MHAFGVEHSVRTHPDLRGDTELSGQVAAIIPHLRKLRDQGVTRIGVETKTNGKVPNEVYNFADRYFRAVELRAKRNGIEVVHVEDSPHSKALHVVAGALWHIGRNSFEADTPADFQKLIEDVAKEAGHDLDVTNRAKLIGAIVYVHPREMDKKSALHLMRVVNFERSLEMYKRAKELGVTHIVVGAAHARDLDQSKLANVTYVGRANGTWTKREINVNTSDLLNAIRRTKFL